MYSDKYTKFNNEFEKKNEEKVYIRNTNIVSTLFRNNYDLKNLKNEEKYRDSYRRHSMLQGPPLRRR